MGFFDDLSKNAKSFAEKAVKKTGEVAESAKLTISLKSEESKLEGLFSALGKLCYDKADDGLIAAQILEIDEQKTVIAQIKAEIAANSGKSYCAGCGKEISSDSAFCPHCGAKQEQKKNITKSEPAPAKTAESVKPTAAKAEPVEAKPESKPLTAAEFIEFFKATMVKYGFAK
ncbi:MAG: zinc-ribbon domain-containing protein [Clostridiales bacterium]|nr:zinc-ribbon domain-containing protein [Clostridiales bacterium]